MYDNSDRQCGPPADATESQGGMFDRIAAQDSESECEVVIIRLLARVRFEDGDEMRFDETTVFSGRRIKDEMSGDNLNPIGGTEGQMEGEDWREKGRIDRFKERDDGMSG